MAVGPKEKFYVRSRDKISQRWSGLRAFAACCWPTAKRLVEEIDLEDSVSPLNIWVFIALYRDWCIPSQPAEKGRNIPPTNLQKDVQDAANQVSNLEYVDFLMEEFLDEEFMNDMYACFQNFSNSSTQ